MAFTVPDACSSCSVDVKLLTAMPARSPVLPSQSTGADADGT